MKRVSYILFLFFAAFNAQFALGQGDDDAYAILRNSSRRTVIPLSISSYTVYAMAEDNRGMLWFGTNNGAFHISNDGLTEYLHFTTENSPLLSNSIENIAIDSDGIVYFSTENGLISYRGTATPGGKTNSDVIVFPNPVRQDYSGVIGIKGLVEDALVKITTTSGAFVTHLRAEGGQAVWDRTDIKGRKVEPGIYIIFVSETPAKRHTAPKY